MLSVVDSNNNSIIVMSSCAGSQKDHVVKCNMAKTLPSILTNAPNRHLYRTTTTIDLTSNSNNEVLSLPSGYSPRLHGSSRISRLLLQPWPWPRPWPDPPKWGDWDYCCKLSVWSWDYYLTYTRIACPKNTNTYLRGWSLQQRCTGKVCQTDNDCRRFKCHRRQNCVCTQVSTVHTYPV